MELCHQQAGGAEDEGQLTLKRLWRTQPMMKEVGKRRKFRLLSHLGCPVTMQLL